jgi:hypothetical protein
MGKCRQKVSSTTGSRETPPPLRADVTGSRLEGSLWSFALIAARSSAGAVGGATCSRQRHSARWRAPPSSRRSSTIRIRLVALLRFPGPTTGGLCYPARLRRQRSNGRRRPAEDARRQPRNAAATLVPRSRGAPAWAAYGMASLTRHGQCSSKTVDAVFADNAGHGAWCRPLGAGLRAK